MAKDIIPNMIKENLLLKKLPDAELMAAIALDDEPLYKYAVETESGKQLNILVLGTGSVARNMVKLALSCGQMLNYTLNLHILAKDASVYEAELKAQAPMLATHVSINGNACSGKQLASMRFHNVKGLNTPQGNQRVFSLLENYRYIVVDLPQKNDVMVNTLLKICQEDPVKRFIVYSGNTIVEKDKALRHLTLSCNTEWTEAKQAAITSIGERAFRVHYYYERHGNPYKNKQACRTEFADGKPGEKLSDTQYAQRANLATVIHMKYKLQSIDINPAAKGKTIMQQCAAKLYGADTTLFDALSCLEHDRWLMEKVMEGFRPTTVAGLQHLCFVGKSYKWRYEMGTARYHNCMLGCLPRSQSSLKGLSHQEWDAKYTGSNLERTLATIDAADEYDPLDRMSLTVHALAQHMMNERHTRLLAELDVLAQHIAILTADKDAQQGFTTIRDWLKLVLNGAELYRSDEMIQLLADSAAILPAAQRDSATQLIAQTCMLSREFYAYKDYKALDDDMINHLPVLYSSSDYTTVLKIASEHLIDNVASPLLLEPDQVVYFGMAQDVCLNVEQFFANRGGFVTLRRVNEGRKRISTLQKEISAAAAQGLCIVDVTGAEATDVMAVSDIVRETNNAAMITCDSKNQRIINLLNYPQALCIRRHVRLKVADLFCLIGAQQQHRVDANDALMEKGNIDKLWEYYATNEMARRKKAAAGKTNTAGEDSNFGQVLAAMTCFMDSKAKSSQWRVPVYCDKLSELGPNTNRQYVKHECPLSIFREYQLENLLNKLEAVKLITELSIDLDESMQKATWKGCVESRFYTYAKDYLCYSPTNKHFKPVKAVKRNANRIDLDWANDEDRQLYVNAEFAVNAGKCEIQYFSKAKKLQTCILDKENIKTVLRDMENKNMIYLLSIDEFPGLKPKLVIKFFFKSEAIKRFFQMSGSFLEAKVWAEAEALQQFDEVCTNYKFRWSAENVTENELDVLMVKGMQLAICSCKATQIDKAFLYEIYCLAKRFSRDAQPVLVHTGKISDVDVQRAQMLGVTLADAFCEDNLQQTLRSIANQ